MGTMANTTHRTTYMIRPRLADHFIDTKHREYYFGNSLL